MELEAVVGAHRVGLIGQSGTMEGSEQPVAAAVTGEDAAGAVRPVRRWGQADKNDACFRIAEPGNRTPPVHLIGEGGTLLGGDPFPPLDKPRASPTGDNV